MKDVPMEKLLCCSIVSLIALSLTVSAQDGGTDVDTAKQVQKPQDPNLDRLREIVAPSLRYNDARAVLLDGNTISGLYDGLDGNSVCLLVDGQPTFVSLDRMKEFSINVEPKAWKAAVTGMVVVDLLGNLLFYNSTPSGFLKGSKQGINLADLAFVTLGASVGYMLNPRHMGEEVFSSEYDGGGDSIETRTRFVGFLSGNWGSRLHLSVEGGSVNTRQKKSGFSNGTAEGTNILRGLRLTYSLLEYLRVGAGIMRIGEPEFVVNSVTGNGNELESLSSGTLYALLVEVSPPRQAIASEFEIVAGVGLGFMQIDYERLTNQWPLGYYYWTPPETETVQSFSYTSLGATTYVNVGVYVHRGLSLSLSYDYTVAIGRKFPEFAAAGLPAETLGNQCVGLTIGLHF